jgi:hypothetical protein
MINPHMPLDVLYIPLDWPEVPEDICKKLLEYSTTAENIWEGRHIASRIVNGKEEVRKALHFAQYKAPDYLINWVRENIPEIPQHYIIRLQGPVGMYDIGYHKDGMRSSAFNFLITDDPGTTMWVDDNDRLVGQVNYTPKIWYQHQGQLKHCVKGCAEQRLSVTIFEYEIQPWNVEHARSMGMPDILTY